MKWKCRYPGCENIIDDDSWNGNKKHCEGCKVKSVQDSREKYNEKRRLRRMMN